MEEFAAMLGTEVFYGENGRYSIDDKNGKFHLDLKKINERLLQRAGLTKIAATNYCTCLAKICSTLIAETAALQAGCAPASCCFKKSRRFLPQSEDRIYCFG